MLSLAAMLLHENAALLFLLDKTRKNLLTQKEAKEEHPKYIGGTKTKTEKNIQTAPKEPNS